LPQHSLNVPIFQVVGHADEEIVPAITLISKFSRRLIVAI